MIFNDWLHDMTFENLACVYVGSIQILYGLAGSFPTSFAHADSLSEGKGSHLVSRNAVDLRDLVE